jgi:hypothetical protein
VATSARCATFSWGRVGDADSYELAVYRVDERGGVESEPYLTERIAGGALSFTPEPGRCPARGESYAWSVRAATIEGATEWSEPYFFEVESQLSEEELSWALEILHRRAAHGGEVAGVEGGRGVVVGEIAATTTSSARSDESSESGLIRAAPVSLSVSPRPAALKVTGEVRTVDAADPGGPSRLWGTGRVALDSVNGKVPFALEVPCEHGGVKFGLSDAMVDWGSAADACPAGTWVCRISEVEACDTVREDDFTDAWSCDSGNPIDLNANDHRGWVAGLGPAGFGGYFTESGLGAGAGTVACMTYPVWCCWE